MSIDDKTRFPKGATHDVWCTAEGTLMPVEGLERSHFRAIVAMLVRNVFREKLRIAHVLHLQGWALQELLAMPPSTFLLKYCPTWETLTNLMVEKGITIHER